MLIITKEFNQTNNIFEENYKFRSNEGSTQSKDHKNLFIDNQCIRGYRI